MTKDCYDCDDGKCTMNCGPVIPPDVLANALQDKVHRDEGKGRGAKTVKSVRGRKEALNALHHIEKVADSEGCFYDMANAIEVLRDFLQTGH